MTRRGARRAGGVRGTGYVEARTKGAAPDLLDRLRDDPAVAEVSLDYQRRTAATPNDPYFVHGDQSYLDTVRLPQAWDLGKIRPARSSRWWTPASTVCTPICWA